MSRCAVRASGCAAARALTVVLDWSGVVKEVGKGGPDGGRGIRDLGRRRAGPIRKRFKEHLLPPGDSGARGGVPRGLSRQGTGSRPCGAQRQRSIGPDRGRSVRSLSLHAVIRLVNMGWTRSASAGATAKRELNDLIGALVPGPETAAPYRDFRSGRNDALSHPRHGGVVVRCAHRLPSHVERCR